LRWPFSARSCAWSHSPEASTEVFSSPSPSSRGSVASGGGTEGPGRGDDRDVVVIHAAFDGGRGRGGGARRRRRRSSNAADGSDAGGAPLEATPTPGRAEGAGNLELEGLGRRAGADKVAVAVGLVDAAHRR